MKAVILAGGLGTRISEETHLKPKPMIEIGGKPILWHIMKTYSAHDINEFVICCGYKGYMIKEYFANYFLHMSDVTIDIKNNKMEIHQMKAEPWTITLVDTGEQTMTGGRLKRIEKYVDETFCLTYGDGLSDINIAKLIEFHKKNKTIGTVSAVKSPGRFGSLIIQGDKVAKFVEKPPGDSNRINGGFFVFEYGIMDYLEGDQEILEKKPLERLALEGQLSSFIHDGFWEPTFLEKNISILDSKKDIVGSVGKIGIIGNYYHKFDYDQNDNIIIKFYKKIRQHYLSLKYFGTYGGKYEDRVRMCLKSFRYGLFIFSVFRTDVLKKSANFHIIPWDWGLILLILKYGNLHVIDEVLQCRNPGGISNSNAISFFSQRNIQLYHLLFPKIPFTKWCIKNLGLKIFFQNIIFFIRINYSGSIIILLDLLKYFRLQTNRKNYYFEKDLLPE